MPYKSEKINNPQQNSDSSDRNETIDKRMQQISTKEEKN